MTTLQKGLFLFLTIFMVILAICINHVSSREQQRAAEIKNKIVQLEVEFDRTQKKFYSVELSAYSPTKEQTNSDPFLTASMTKIKPGHTAAVSRDLLPFLMGRKIYVEGHGVWTVQDVTNKRVTNTIDLCFATTKQAQNFGKKQAFIVILNEEKAMQQTTELFLKDIRPLFALPDGTNLMDTGTREEMQKHIKAIEGILDYVTAFAMLMVDSGATQETLKSVNKKLQILKRPTLQIGQTLHREGD